VAKYHFGGSFSLRAVLPALVPELVYDDLEIQDGNSASTALEALLLDADALGLSERQALRRDLLRYCERDTLAMVRIHERLRELAGLTCGGRRSNRTATFDLDPRPAKGIVSLVDAARASRGGPECLSGIHAW
jgi:hypothetical protein